MATQRWLDDLIVQSFNHDEFDGLCFKLNINPDVVSGRSSGLKTRALELITYCDRHNQLLALIERLKAERPAVDWVQASIPHAEDATQTTPDRGSDSKLNRRAAIATIITVPLAILIAIVAFFQTDLRRIFKFDPLPAVTPVAPPFASARATETLILLGGFYDRSGGKTPNVDVIQRTYDALLDQIKAKSLKDIRVEQLPATTEIKTDAEALAIGKQYRAKLVIWGYKDETGSSIRTKRMDDPQAGASARSELTYNATTVPICLSEDAPAQGSFLALFSLGESLIEWSVREKVVLANTLITAALDSIEARPLSASCSRFNPSKAYGLQGHLYGTLAKFFLEDEKSDLDIAIDFRHKAIAAYGKSLAMQNDASWVIIGKGVSQSELAYVLVLKAKLNLQLDDRNTDVNLTLRIQYLKEAVSVLRQAIEGYDQYIKLNSENPEIWLAKGNSQSALADQLPQFGLNDEALILRRQAIESCNRALFLKPDYYSANFSRGLIYQAIASWQAMFDDFNTVVQAEPNNYQAYFLRGTAASELGKRNDAEVDFRKVLKLTQDRFYVSRARQELSKLGAQP